MPCFAREILVLRAHGTAALTLFALFKRMTFGFNVRVARWVSLSRHCWRKIICLTCLRHGGGWRFCYYPRRFEVRASTANVYRARLHVILFIVVHSQALYSSRCHIRARLLLFSVPAKAFGFYGTAVALC